MSKFKLTKPAAGTPAAGPTPEQVAAFAAGADARRAVHADQFDGLRDERRTEIFNLRLTEKERAMLRYIADHSPDSAHGFCIRILRPAIEAAVADLQAHRP